MAKNRVIHKGLFSFFSFGVKLEEKCLRFFNQTLQKGVKARVLPLTAWAPLSRGSHLFSV